MSPELQNAIETSIQENRIVELDVSDLDAAVADLLTWDIDEGNGEVDYVEIKGEVYGKIVPVVDIWGYVGDKQIWRLELRRARD